MSIGKNIAKFRKAKKLTQEELGTQLYVTNQAVSKWESEVSMPDIMLLPQIAKVLDVTLEQLYGIENAEKIAVTPDAFPNYVQKKLHRIFYDHTRMRFTHIDRSDESQIAYQTEKFDNGCRIGCISNTQGAVVMTKDFSFVDCNYKAPGSENIFTASEDAWYTLMHLTDKNLRKVLLYQYKSAFEKSKKSNSEFTFVEIMQACCLTKEEVKAALHLLKEININETYTDRKSGDKKCVFKISNAVYALAIYKLAEMLSEDDPVWTVVRDTSMISDYAF